MSDRLEQRRAARDREIQQEIDDPNTTRERRQQLLRLQRRRHHEGRSSSSTMSTLDTTPYLARPTTRRSSRQIENEPVRGSATTGISEETRGALSRFLRYRTPTQSIQEVQNEPDTPDAPTSESFVDAIRPRVLRLTRSNAMDDLSSFILNALISSHESLSGFDSPTDDTSPITQELTASDLEEDSDDYSSLRTSDNTLSDEYISESDGSCASEGEGPDTKERVWMKRNCSVCQSMVTLDAFDDEDYPDLVSIKVYDVDSSKFGKGHCIPKPDLAGMLRSDIGSEMPKYIFSLYKKRPDASSAGSLAGLGSAPSNQFVVQLNAGTLSIFVTLGSIHKLLKTTEKVLYAAPLYGGKRRRIGNIAGRLTVVGANHGQIPGFRVYKLFTREEVEAGVEVSTGENDFVIPMTICKKVEELIDVFADTSRIRQIVVDEIIQHIVERK